MEKKMGYLSTTAEIRIFEIVSDNIDCLNSGVTIINGRRIETEMEHIFECPICNYFESDIKWEDVCEIGINHLKKHIMNRRRDIYGKLE